MINKIKYVISEFCHLIVDGDVAVLCNTGNGKIEKIPLECWRTVEQYIGDYTVEEICSAAATEEDKEYYQTVFKLLIDNNYLVPEGYSPLRSVDIVITNRCNLKCTHCCADAFDAVGEDPMSTDDIKRLIDELIRLNVETIVITGGEPMLRKDFFEISEYLRANFKGKTNLMTNGTLINEKNIDHLIELFDGFNISLDGYDEETCSKIRGKGVFTKVTNVLEMFKQRNYNMGRIALSMVETAYTYGNDEKFRELNRKFGTKTVIRQFSPTGRGAVNNDELSIKASLENIQEEMEKSNKLIEDIKNGKVDKKQFDNSDSDPLFCRSCVAGIEKFAITHEGNIVPCMLLDGSDYFMGNILELESIYDYIKNKEYRNTSGFENMKCLIPKYNKKCSDCECSPFCIYCYADFSRYINSPDFEKGCQAKKNELKYIWRYEV